MTLQKIKLGTKIHNSRVEFFTCKNKIISIAATDISVDVIWIRFENFIIVFNREVLESRAVNIESIGRADVIKDDL